VQVWKRGAGVEAGCVVLGISLAHERRPHGLPRRASFRSRSGLLGSKGSLGAARHRCAVEPLARGASGAARGRRPELLVSLSGASAC
jgi:hypothetical protein